MQLCTGEVTKSDVKGPGYVKKRGLFTLRVANVSLKGCVNLIRTQREPSLPEWVGADGSGAGGGGGAESE